jgi:predicted metalloprotease
LVDSTTVINKISAVHILIRPTEYLFFIMKWRNSRRSHNVDDFRGQSTPRSYAKTKFSGIGLVIVIVVGLLSGQSPLQLIELAMNSNSSVQRSTETVRQNQSSSQTAKQDDGKQFVSVMLASNEDIWNKHLPKQASLNYKEPRLTLFSQKINSACGMASSASGPFYCPADQRIYIDLAFFQELQRMGAAGDFAQAYVIAHEVGHHVQNLLGISTQVARLQQRTSKQKANKLSVLLELQADCYAGLWAHHSEKNKAWLEQGDLEEGLQAASAIGDDQLQRNAGQRVNPDAFTHGTSKQRQHWLSIGLKYGEMQRCNTFSKK